MALIQMPLLFRFEISKHLELMSKRKLMGMNALILIKIFNKKL